MGTLGGGNGGNWPPDGGGPPDDLPEIPPEWGTIVIPDDAAELDPEATKIRRELRHEARVDRWRRRLHLPQRGPAGTPQDETTVGVPVLVIVIAVLATLLSLFVVAWPANQHTTPAPTPATGTTSASGTAHAEGAVLPDVTFTSAGGGQVRLHDTLPAVVLLVEGCACDELIAQTAAAVGSTGGGIGVLTVARSTPPTLPAGARAWAVTDPAGALWSAVPDLPTGAGKASVLLVDAHGILLRAIAAASSVEEFRADLMKLKL